MVQISCYSALFLVSYDQAKFCIIAGPHCGNRIAAKLLLVFLNFCCLSVDGRVTRVTRGFLSSRNTSNKSNMFDFLPVLLEFLAILLPQCGRFSHRRCWRTSNSQSARRFLLCFVRILLLLILLLLLLLLLLFTKYNKSIQHYKVNVQYLLC